MMQLAQIALRTSDQVTTTGRWVIGALAIVVSQLAIYIALRSHQAQRRTRLAVGRGLDRGQAPGNDSAAAEVDEDDDEMALVRRVILARIDSVEASDT